MILRCDWQVAMLPLSDVQLLVGQALTNHSASQSAHMVICSSWPQGVLGTYLFSDACPECSREATALLWACMLGLCMCEVGAVPCDMQAAERMRH